MSIMTVCRGDRQCSVNDGRLDSGALQFRQVDIRSWL